MGRVKALTDKQLEWALMNWKKGYTWAEIGEALFVTPQALNTSIRKHFGCQNYNRRRPHLIYKENVIDKELEWAFKMWNLGYTWSEIADALFVSENTLRKSMSTAYDLKNLKRVRPQLIYREDL